MSDEIGQAPVHVLQVVGNAIIGGMESYVLNLARRLPQTRFRITAIVPFESSFTESLREVGCTVRVTPIEDAIQFRSLASVVEEIQYEHVNVVQSHLTKAHYLAGLAARLCNTPAIATIHGMNVSPEDLMAVRLSNMHAHLVCHSGYVNALAMGLPPDRCHEIPNGVDIERFRPRSDSEARAAFRAQLGLGPEALLVGQVARLSPEKAGEVLVRSVRTAVNANPNIHFIFVGEGPHEQTIRNTISAEGVQDRVHLIGPRRDTEAVYPLLDMLALTSVHEGQPMCILEAMACGLPVLASDVGGVPELICANETGLLFRSGDYVTLGNHLGWLMNKPDLRQKMGIAARKRAEQRFDLSRSVEGMAHVLQRLAGLADFAENRGRQYAAAHANGASQTPKKMRLHVAH